MRNAVLGVVIAVALSVGLIAQTLKCDCTVFSNVITPTVNLSANGTAGSPALFFTGDVTHGLYHVSSGILGLSASLYAGTDATYDFGLAAASRFRNGFFSGILAAAKVQVGAGAVSTSNITLRSSDVAGMLTVMLGDESNYGDQYVGRLGVGGNGGSVGNFATFTSPQSGNPLASVLQAIKQSNFTMGVGGNDYTGAIVAFQPTASVNITGNQFGLLSVTQTPDAETHTLAALDGVYGASYSGGTNTTTFSAGLNGDAEQGGTGNITNMSGTHTSAGTFGTGTVTNNSGLWVDLPFNVGGGAITNNFGLRISDQTVTSTISHGIYYAAPSSHQYDVRADGTIGEYGAVPTALSPLRVGGTMSSILTNNGNSSTAQTIDWSKGNVQRTTLTGNVTWTFTNPVDGGQYVFLIYTGAGSFTGTFPAAVKWPAASAPTITVTASRMDVVRCTYDATATDYFCMFSGSQNFTP